MKSIEQNTLVKQEMGEIQQFICELCGFSFSNETYLANHYNFCKYVKNQNDRLGVNTRNILEKRMSLTEQNTLVKQEIEPCEKLPEIQQYICELCSFTFSNETYLANHYNLCKDMMNQNDRLGVNTRNIREKKMSLTEQNTLVKQEIVPCEKLPEIQQRICEFCGFTFSNETYLANHYNLCKDMMNQNDRLGVNTRNIREKKMSLSEQNTLVKQEIVPCEKLPEIQQYICELCSFTFSNETYLANHYNLCKDMMNQNDRLGVNTRNIREKKMSLTEQNTLVKQEIVPCEKLPEIQQRICEFCGFTFSNETYLANHYNLCKDMMNQNDRLGVNTRNIREKKMSLSEQNTLVKQEIVPCEKLPEIQQYICELCSFTFSNETYLANHYNLCKDMMNQNDRLGVNTRNIREKKMSLTEQNTLVKQEIVPCEKLPEIQQRICEFCGFTFSNETYLANHYNLCKDMMNQNDRLGVNTRNIREKKMSLSEQNTLVKQEIVPCEKLPEIQQYICELCSFTFSNETYLANHYNLCKDMMNQNDRLGVNTRNIREKKMSLSEQNTLVKQEIVPCEKLPEIQQYICELCSFTFSNETYLANHSNLCKDMMNQNDRLGVNTRNIREKKMSLTEQNTLVKQEIEPCEKLPEIQQYICELCSFTFSNETYLANHYNLCKDMKNQNDRLGVNTRNILEKRMSLTEQNTLVKQEIVPCEKLPEIQQCICEFCGFTFSNETYLANHYNFCKYVKNQNDRLGVNTRNILEKRMSLTEQNTLVKQEIGPCEELPEIQQCICEFCGFTFSNETYLANHYNFCKYVKNQNDRLGVNTTIVKKELCEDEEMRNSEAPNKNIKDEPMFDINIDFDLESIELPTTKTLVKSRKAKKCTICGYSTLRADNLRRHMNTHTVQKQFKCTICNFSASRSDSLRHHMIRHKVTGKKELFERDIPKLEASDENMKAKPMYDINIDLDLRSIEPSTTETLVKSGKAKKCTVCDYSTLRSDNLQRHINKRHPEVNPIKCTICNYATAQPGNLEVHMKSHTVTVTKALREEDVQNLEAPDENGKAKKAKPIYDINVDLDSKSIEPSTTETLVKSGKAKKCTVCDYSTLRSDNLQRHINKRHPEVNPIKCTICNYATAQPGNLEVHMKSHTVTVTKALREEDVQNLEAPDENGKAKKAKPMYDINVKKSIKRSRTETSVKTNKAFKCTVCDFSTDRSDNLKRHMKRHTVTVERELYERDVPNLVAPDKNIKPKPMSDINVDMDLESIEPSTTETLVKSGKAQKCTFCDYSTLRSDNLKRHMIRQHTGVKSELSAGRRQHRAKPRKPNTFDCKYCDYTTTQRQLKRHISSHKKGNPFKCRICDYTTVEFGHFKVHTLTHAVENTFKCTICKYSTARSENLKRHMRRHTGEKAFKCTICDYSSMYSIGLKYHMAKHTGLKPLKCTECDYSTTRLGQLNNHISRHKGVKPYKCTICDHTTLDFGHLKLHMLTHTGERPFKCTICNYSCSQSGNLKIHMRKHTGERPFKCSICEYSAKQLQSLKNHIKTHTGEKAFKCTICDYSAPFPEAIKRHMVTHTGEKAHKCTICGMSFTQSGSVKRHMLLRHASKE